MLLKKIKNKTSLIGIFGLGYIGLPRCIQFVKKGYRVIGFTHGKTDSKINLEDSLATRPPHAY